MHLRVLIALIVYIFLWQFEHHKDKHLAEGIQDLWRNRHCKQTNRETTLSPNVSMSKLYWILEISVYLRLNSSYCIGLMILSSEIWSERKMAEMSRTIVCPILFKQIARAGRHRLRERASEGRGRETKRERERSVNERLCVLPCVCIVNNWRRLSRKWGDKGQ